MVEGEIGGSMVKGLWRLPSHYQALSYDSEGVCSSKTGSRRLYAKRSSGS